MVNLGIISAGCAGNAGNLNSFVSISVQGKKEPAVESEGVEKRKKKRKTKRETKRKTKELPCLDSCMKGFTPCIYCQARRQK